jgi:hypothetical protein
MKRKPFFRSPLFWAALVILSVCSLIFLSKNFEKANPMVNVKIESSRDEVLKMAGELSLKHNLGPEGYKQAASFSNDTRFQNYTELEGGGLDKFNEVIGKGIYHSYQWKVRQFKENEVNEVTLFFTPAGKPYGFSEKMSENLTNHNLTSDSAFSVAKDALSQWDFDISVFALEEKKVVEKPGGRLDHEFVFERKDVRVNECSFRIAVLVSGNKVTRIENIAHVPENFDRRFAEMRSENDLINTIGFAILYIIYGLIAAGLGLLFLMKRRFIIWKKALFWALGIGLATGLLEVLNILPLLWFNYDTSSSVASFIGRNLFNGLLNTLLMGGIIFLSAVVGEGLGRFLFPKHLQFWKLWSSETGGSIQVMGQTIGAYLFVPVVLAIDIVYYLITTHYLGWWNPAGTLSDPDILAQNLPWFGPIANSLQAGFWEELICRAVPLAGVYLLVRNLKTKNLWMILTLFAQTIIFGMLHANYPQSPSYIRVVEMIIPFFIFGLLYLRFGLLPVMITHYAVDVFWMSLPVWVANTPGIWLSKTMIAILFFAPLLIVIYLIIKNRKPHEAPESAYNQSWAPAPKNDTDEEEQHEEKQIQESNPLIPFSLKWLVPAAIAGLILWYAGTSATRYNNSDVTLTRTEAIAVSTKLLKEKFDFQPDNWKVLTGIKSMPSEAHKFIWQTNPKEYDKLQQSILPVPYWNVRFVNTSAPVEERAEEFIVNIGIDGRIIGYQHIWPEKRTGIVLTETEALEKAKANFEGFLNRSSSSVRVIKIEPSKTEWRTNWQIELTDTALYNLREGMGLFKTTISADEVSETTTYIKPSENWKRNFDRQKSTIKIFNLISNLTMYLVLIMGIVFGFVNWSRRKFSTKLFILFGSVFAGLSMAGLFNAWNLMISSYFTGLPFSNYLTMTIVGSIIGIIFLSMGIAVIGGFSSQITLFDRYEKRGLLKATLLGILFTGLFAIEPLLLAPTGPRWTNLSNLNDIVPAFGFLNDNLFKLIFNPAYLMFVFYFVNWISHRFSKMRLLALFIIFLSGFLIFGANSETLNNWFISGIIGGIIYVLAYLFLMKNLSWAVIVLIIPLIFSMVETAIMGHTHCLVTGILVTIAASYLFSVFWYIQIRKRV